MDTYQSRQKRSLRRDHRNDLRRFLFILIVLSILGITTFLLVVGPALHDPNMPQQHPTSPPVVVISPTPTLTPTLSPTPTPTPTVSSTPSPTPSPTPPPPGVLGYPLYSGNPYRPEIALTFDDGPNPSYTPQILALLQHYDVKATFFVIGSQAAAYPDLVQQESQHGNSVGNHAWTHPDLTSLSPAEIGAELQSASSEIQADSGVVPTVFHFQV